MFSPRTATVAVLLLLSISAPSRAQEITYTTVTRAEMGGALGQMMKMVPDADREMRQTIYLKGVLMRTDEGASSTITDMEAGAFTILDHETRTYFTTTLDEMRARMEAMQAQMGEAMGEPVEQTGPEGEAPFDLRLSTERTGRTQRFDGYSAEQFLVTMEVVPSAPEAAAGGATVIFTEHWLSTDFPGYQAYQEAQKRMADAFMEGRGGPSLGAMASQFMAGHPGLAEAFEKNFEEMGKMEGVPVKTVTHVVTVPHGASFDPEAVLAAAGQPLATSGESLTGQAAAAAAREAMGRISGGLLGRRRQQAEPEAEAPAAQSITMRTTALIEELRTGAIADDLFRPPPGYTERKPDWMGGGGR